MNPRYTMSGSILLVLYIINVGLTIGEQEGAVINFGPDEEGYQLYYHIGEQDKPVVTEIPKYYAPSLTDIHSTCRFYRQWKNEGASRYDFITDIWTEDNLLLDSLITRNCFTSDMRVGIFPGTYERTEPDVEYMVYMTEDAVCHRRTYKLHKMEMTATIVRSEMEDGVECPDEMKNRPQGHIHMSSSSSENYNGFVLAWSPVGKYLHTGYTKNSITESVVDSKHSFVGETPKGMKYKLVCKEHTVKEGDKTVTFITGTIFLSEGITLDRFKLTSCTPEVIKNTFLPSIQDDSYSLIFKDKDKQCFRREYDISVDLSERQRDKLRSPSPGPDNRASFTTLSLLYSGVTSGSYAFLSFYVL